MNNKKILDKKTTAKIADLIKIHIPDDQLESYTNQLNSVLGAVEVLKELDTKDVSATSQTHGLENVLRTDEVKPGLDMSKYKNTRNFRKGYFVVKKVL